jgi:hypothetical protein
VPGNTAEASTFAIGEQVYGEDLSGVAEVDAYFLPGNDAPEDFAGPMPGNTTEASTFAIGEQVYGEDLSGVAEVDAYFLPGNDAPEDYAGQKSGTTQEASTYSIGEIYEYDLSGLVDDVPEDFAGPMPGNTQGLGDWEQCSRNSQCSNGCCSDAAIAGVFKCTPLSGNFDPSICTAV